MAITSNTFMLLFKVRCNLLNIVAQILQNVQENCKKVYFLCLLCFSACGFTSRFYGFLGDFFDGFFPW